MAKVEESYNLLVLNCLLEEFVLENIQKDGSYLDVLKYTKNLLNIFFDNTKIIKEKQYRKKVDLNKSIANAMDFLASIDLSYAKYLEDRIKDGTIEFQSAKELDKKREETLEYDNYDPSYLSYSTYENDRRLIHIVYEENFGDAYIIIHEILHDMNLMGPELCGVVSDDYFDTRDTFTELVSMLGTLLAKKYFEKNNYKGETDIDLIDEHYCMAIKCVTLDFAINLVERFLEKGHIDRYDIFDLMEKDNEFYCQHAMYYIEDVAREKDLLIFYNERYLTGLMLSNYIVENYKNPEQVLKDLNEMIQKNLIEHIFTYLDLDCIVTEEDNLIDLEKDTLKKLDMSLRKGMKHQ